MVMNTRDKEITDQPKLNHFDLNSNSTCNNLFKEKLKFEYLLCFLQMQEYPVGCFTYVKTNMIFTKPKKGCQTNIKTFLTFLRKSYKSKFRNLIPIICTLIGALKTKKNTGN